MVADVRRLLGEDGLHERAGLRDLGHARATGSTSCAAASSTGSRTRSRSRERLTADVARGRGPDRRADGDGQPGDIRHGARPTWSTPAPTRPASPSSSTRSSRRHSCGPGARPAGRSPRGWPGCRPDPLRRLHLEGGDRAGRATRRPGVDGADVDARTDTGAARPRRQRGALGGRPVTEGMARPWANAVRAGLRSRLDRRVRTRSTRRSPRLTSGSPASRVVRAVRGLQWLLCSRPRWSAACGSVPWPTISYLQLPSRQEVDVGRCSGADAAALGGVVARRAPRWLGCRFAGRRWRSSPRRSGRRSGCATRSRRSPRSWWSTRCAARSTRTRAVRDGAKARHAEPSPLPSTGPRSAASVHSSSRTARSSRAQCSRLVPHEPNARTGGPMLETVLHVVGRRRDRRRPSQGRGEHRPVHVPAGDHAAAVGPRPAGVRRRHHDLVHGAVLAAAGRARPRLGPARRPRRRGRPARRRRSGPRTRSRLPDVPRGHARSATT